MSLKKLNEIANERFEKLKAKQGHEHLQDLEYKNLPKPPVIDTEKIEGVYTNSASRKQEESVKEKDFIDKIDALSLPPNLSLAVSFIVIANNGDKEALQKAIDILEGEV